MRLSLWSTTLASITLTTAALAFSGCDHRATVLAPRGESGLGFRAPTLVRRVPPGSPARPGQYRHIWPHEDGRAWTYRLETRVWDTPDITLYPSPDQVPVLTLDDAAALLGHHPIGENPVTTTGSYGLRFHGLVTTLSGVTRQNLEETLTQGGARAAAVVAERPGRAFMRLLKRARPDLARKIGALDPTPDREASSSFPPGPSLLHGYAWEQTDEWIGTYGDLNQQIAWIFLTPNLAPGSEFTLQLVPDLADDVFLHARVLGWKSVSTEAGVFRHAVEVLYFVDFGISKAVDIDGNALGYSGSCLYGTVSYAVGVGPVHSYERFVPFTSDPLGPGTGDFTSGLVATEPGARDVLAER